MHKSDLVIMSEGTIESRDSQGRNAKNAMRIER